MTKTRHNFMKALLAFGVCALLAIAVICGTTAATSASAATAIENGKLFLKEESYGPDWNCVIETPTPNGGYHRNEVPIVNVKKATGTTEYNYVVEWNKSLAAYRSATYSEWLGINIYYGVENGTHVKIEENSEYVKTSDVTVQETGVSGKTSPINIIEAISGIQLKTNTASGVNTDMETMLTVSATLPDNTTDTVKILFRVIEDDDIFAPLTFSRAQEAGPDRHMVLLHFGNDFSLLIPGGQFTNCHQRTQLKAMYDNVLFGKNAVGDQPAVPAANVVDAMSDTGYRGSSGNVRLNWHIFDGYLEFIRYEGASDTIGTAFQTGEYVIVKKGFMLMDPSGACIPDADGKILRTERDMKFVFNLGGNLTWTEVYGINSVASEKEEDSVEVGKTTDLSGSVSVVGNVKVEDGGEYSTDLVWSSEDTSIATVNNGVVTGVAKGTTFIVATSATDATKSVRIKVSVIGDDEVGSINFSADWTSYKVLSLDLDDDAKKSVVVKCYVAGGENANLAVNCAVNQEGVIDIATAEKTDADGTKYTELTVTALKPCNGARVTVTSKQNSEVANFFTVNVTGTPAPEKKEDKGCGCGSSVAGATSVIVALGLIASAAVVFIARKRKNA